MIHHLALDGGGTKTEGILTDAHGHVLARRVTGPSNPNDVTLPTAADTVAALAETLLTDAEVDPATASVTLYAGIAGALNHRAALESALRARLPTVTAIGVGSDAPLLLSSALPEGDGACLICGTGCACFVRRGSDMWRIGGWGYLLDGGGSGYNIGRDAIEAVLGAYDGRGLHTTLTRRLAAHYGAPVETLISTVYAEGKPYIASCAPAVFEAAEADRDSVATHILQRNARALARHVNAAWDYLRADGRTPPDTLPVVMGGSIGQREPSWPRLVASLVDVSVPARITVADHPPILGALVEAALLAAEGSTVDFPALRAAFDATYPEKFPKTP